MNRDILKTEAVSISKLNALAKMYTTHQQTEAAKRCLLLLESKFDSSNNKYNTKSVRLVLY